jgi:hypothetical protein
MFEVKRSAMVGSRLDFAAVCNAKGLKTAVEVGTDRGLFALDFLSRWNGEMLYCVDPYCAYPQMPWNRDGDLIMTAVLLAPHARRVRIVRTTSADAAAQIGMVDFVYIDAAHTFEAVTKDLTVWWDNVRLGGLLAGHDFDAEHQEVQDAVSGFARRLGLRLEVGVEYNFPPSWYIEK